MARDDTPSSRPLLDKLGVRHGARVVLVNWAAAPGGAEFEELLHDRTDAIGRRLTGKADLVFMHAGARRDLDRLAGLRATIWPAGAIWVTRVKGRDAVIKDTELIDAGLRAGMVDNKIASFSDTLAAMRFVIRLSDR